MISNIKTELIYYNAPKDFAFEFNMNSACQMRLLTGVVSEPRDLLGALSKAVTRSRVIIIMSEINDSFISLIAQTIGFKTEVLDKASFGITSALCENLITNSVPLVSSDGVFGGFILESGPQSLIAITPDRNTRTELMNSFVNQYLNDLSDYIPPVPAPEVYEEHYVPESVETENALINNQTEEQSNTEADFESAELEITEVDNTHNEVIIEEAEIIENEVQENTDAFTASADTNEDVHISETTVDEGSTDIFPDTEIYFDADGNRQEETDQQPKITKKRNPINIPILILSIILCALIAFIVYSLFIEPTLNGVSIIDNIKDLFSFLM